MLDLSADLTDNRGMTNSPLHTRTKVLPAWTNDEGRSFPAETAYLCTCEVCGWQGAAWHTRPQNALAAYERHSCEKVLARKARS